MSPPRRRLGPKVAIAIFAIVVVALVAASDASRSAFRLPFGTSDATPVPTDDGSAVAASPRSAVRVSSIPELLDALADDTIGSIVVVDGTYHVSPASSIRSDSLWIGGDRYARRTRAVVVQAETRGGVIFDGGGGDGYAGLSFEDGAHDQTWDGFVFADMRADYSGIVEVGGYVPRRAPYNITLRFITIKGSCLGRAVNANAPATEHAFYISNAAGVGPNHLLFEDIAVDGSGGLASAFQFDHGDAADPNASSVTVRRLRVDRTQQAIIFWTPAVHDVTFADVSIAGASRYAVRYETVGSTGIVLSNVTSTRSGKQGFFSSEGATPPGLTLENVDLQ